MIRIMIIVFLLNVSCQTPSSQSGQQKENSSHKQIIKVKTDTAEVVGQADSLLSDIEKKLKTYKKIETVFLGKSSEGSGLVGYYSIQEIKKIFVEHLGESGKATEEYYFDKKQLILVIRKQYNYEKPIYEDNNAKIASEEEERFYFDKNSLIKWIKNDQEIKIKGDNYQKKGQRYIENSEEYENELSKQ